VPTPVTAAELLTLAQVAELLTLEVLTPAAQASTSWQSR
jgi:hypothetical protein